MVRDVASTRLVGSGQPTKCEPDFAATAQSLYYFGIK
jgi:hypothetical protein